MHAGDLADQAVLAAAQEIGLEHPRQDRGRAHAFRLQRLDQAQVLLLEHPAHHRQALRRGHPQAIDGLLLDAGGGHLLVQLRAGAVDDDRRQADLLQKGQRGHQGAEHRRAGSRRRP